MSGRPGRAAQCAAARRWEWSETGTRVCSSGSMFPGLPVALLRVLQWKNMKKYLKTTVFVFCFLVLHVSFTGVSISSGKIEREKCNELPAPACCFTVGLTTQFYFPPSKNTFHSLVVWQINCRKWKKCFDSPRRWFSGAKMLFGWLPVFHNRTKIYKPGRWCWFKPEQPVINLFITRSLRGVGHQVCSPALAPLNPSRRNFASWREVAEKRAVRIKKFLAGSLSFSLSLCLFPLPQPPRNRGFGRKWNQTSVSSRSFLSFRQWLNFTVPCTKPVPTGAPGINALGSPAC